MRHDPDKCRECDRNLRFRSHAPDCPQLIVVCHYCRQQVAQRVCEQVDVSTEDEYYPEFVHLCGSCASDGGELA